MYLSLFGEYAESFEACMDKTPEESPNILRYLKIEPILANLTNTKNILDLRSST
jgi:hypothetical protein